MTAGPADGWNLGLGLAGCLGQTAGQETARFLLPKELNAPVQRRASFSWPHPLPPEHSTLSQEIPGRSRWAQMGETGTSLPGRQAQPVTHTPACLPLPPHRETKAWLAIHIPASLQCVSRLHTRASGRWTGWLGGWSSAMALVWPLIQAFLGLLTGHPASSLGTHYSKRVSSRTVMYYSPPQAPSVAPTSLWIKFRIHTLRFMVLYNIVQTHPVGLIHWNQNGLYQDLHTHF